MAVVITDGSGATALYIACQEGHVEVVTTLLVANAKMDQATHDVGSVPLYMACQQGHTEVVTTYDEDDEMDEEEGDGDGDYDEEAEMLDQDVGE